MHTGYDEHEWYVDKVHWLVHEGRDDLIDEIADEYERRHRRNAALERGAGAPQLRLVS